MEGVIENSPSLSAVAVPISTSPLRRVIVELGSALPVIVGFELFVMEEEVAKEVGASGAVVSIVIEIEADFDEIFPAESVEVAFNE